MSQSSPACDDGLVPTRRPDPPPWWKTAGEAASGLEAARLAARMPRLLRLPNGDGTPVVLTPGLGATDASLAPLRRFLVRKRHDARPAGFGRIVPDVAGLAPRLIDLVADIRRETGRPVNLVGWSLGGVVSREVARHRPDLIGRVITFGTPVRGGPGSTALGARLDPRQLDAIQDMMEARDRVPIRVPITAIRSPRDGVVAADACIDTTSLEAENVVVRSTHIGMGIDPDVWAIVARRLAAPT